MEKLKPIIAPSILSADFARLGEDVERVLDAGADWVHFDVMDNHFVPNLTIGPMVCQALRDYGITAPIDVHLMIERPEFLLNDFVEAGADSITLHVESSEKLKESFEFLKKAGVKKGISLRPKTPLKEIEKYLPELDLVLVMTVEPGFGGQSFMSDQIEKIDAL